MNKISCIYILIGLFTIGGGGIAAAQNLNDAYLNSELKERPINKENWKDITDGLDYSEGLTEIEEDEDEVNVSPSDNNQRDYPTQTSEPGAWASFFKLLFIAIIVIAVVLLILNLVGAGNFKKARSKKRSTDGIDIDLENIEAHIYESDLERYIREAVRKGNYALAIRLYYLAIIKELSLHKVIRWKKDKTNKDYIHEMRKTNGFQAFREVTRIFERVWYGQGVIDQQDYQKLKPQFDALIKAAQSHEINIIKA